MFSGVDIRNLLYVRKSSTNPTWTCAPPRQPSRDVIAIHKIENSWCVTGLLLFLGAKGAGVTDLTQGVAIGALIGVSAASLVFS